MDIMSTVFILLGMASGVILLLREQRKNPGVKISELILKNFKYQFTGWFLVILAVATFAECLVAATTHSVDGSEINQIGRILAHIVLGVFQFISGIAISSSVQTMFSSIRARRIRPMIIYSIQSIILFVGIFYAPVMNLTIMASSLQQVRELNLFLFSMWEMVPFSGVGEMQIRVRALKLGFDQTSVPIELLSPNIVLLLATIGVHMLISAVEILHLLGTDHRGQEGVPGVSEHEYPEKEDTKEEKETKDPVDDEIFSILAGRLSDFSPRERKKIVSETLKTLKGMEEDEEERNKLPELMARAHVLKTETNLDSDHFENIKNFFFTDLGIEDPKN